VNSKNHLPSPFFMKNAKTQKNTHKKEIDNGQIEKRAYKLVHCKQYSKRFERILAVRII